MNARPDLAEGPDTPHEAAQAPSAARVPTRSAPIYYRLPDTPEGHHIKEYASGLRQLVRFVGVEEQVVKYSLA